MGDILPFLGDHWFWWIVGAVLLVGELLLPGIFLLWLAVAAGLTGVVDFMIDLDWRGEIVTFAIFSVALVVASWRYVRSQHRPQSDQPNLNQRHLDYVGRKVVLLKAISNGRGKARVDDTVWDVEGPELPEGALVIVTGVADAVLKVEFVN
jgi:membrane protein implicated in regulation of membrane protease activity